MKENKITENVMKKVVSFEKRRIVIWIIRIFLCLLVVLLIAFISFWFTAREIVEAKTYELLSLFGQDKEIIQEFWQDTLSTFFQELPIRGVVIFLLSLSLAVLFIIVVIKKFPLIKNRILGIKKIVKKWDNKSRK